MPAGASCSQLPYPSMKSECVGLYEKGTVAKKVVFGIGGSPKNGGFRDGSETLPDNGQFSQ